MALYAQGVRTGGFQGPHLEIAAATDRAKLLELGVTNNAFSGTQGSAMFGRSVAIGVASSPSTVIAEDAADPAGTVTLAITWTLIPTVSNVWLRSITFPSNKGIGWVWTFPLGLIIGASSSLVLWTGGNPGNMQFDVWALVDE